MHTNESPILLLPPPGGLATEVQELQVPRGTPAPKQRWAVGDTVKIGSQLLRVAELDLPPARKGEARGTRLVSHDLSRQYIWVPFRGLKVLNGAPKRRKRKAADGPSRPKARPQRAQKIQKMSLWTRALRAVGLH